MRTLLQGLKIDRVAHLLHALILPQVCNSRKKRKTADPWIKMSQNPRNPQPWRLQPLLRVKSVERPKKERRIRRGCGAREYQDTESLRVQGLLLIAASRKNGIEKNTLNLMVSRHSPTSFSALCAFYAHGGLHSVTHPVCFVQARPRLRCNASGRRGKAYCSQASKGMMIPCQVGSGSSSWMINTPQQSTSFSCCGLAKFGTVIVTSCVCETTLNACHGQEKRGA
jgi:hypothetical protein